VPSLDASALYAWRLNPAERWVISFVGESMKTLHEIEEAIETLPLTDRLRLYKDMPQLIGRDVEDLDWQRLALENFFKDDSPDDDVYDRI
jgi:hypothetical protein